MNEPQVMFCLECMHKHTRDIEHHIEDAITVDKPARNYWLNEKEHMRNLRKYLLERMKGNPHETCPTCQDNPGKRLYEPYGLTTAERRAKRMVRGKCTPRSRNRYCRLVRCIKKLEPRENDIKSAVAVCRAKVK